MFVRRVYTRRVAALALAVGEKLDAEFSRSGEGPRAVKTALLLTTRRGNRCVSLRAASAVLGLDARREWVSARAQEEEGEKKKVWRSTRPCLHAEGYPQIIAGLSRLRREVAGFGRPVRKTLP